MTTLVAAAVVWRYLYHTKYGLINHALGWIGVEPIDWMGDPRWSMPAIILLGVWKNFGYNMVIFMAGLASIPAELYEAAEVDGAGPVRALPARDAADARPDVPVRRRDDDDRLLPALRRAVRHDPRRARGQHLQPGDADVRAGLPLVAAGHGLGDCVVLFASRSRRRSCRSGFNGGSRHEATSRPALHMHVASRRPSPCWSSRRSCGWSAASLMPRGAGANLPAAAVARASPTLENFRELFLSAAHGPLFLQQRGRGAGDHRQCAAAQRHGGVRLCQAASSAAATALLQVLLAALVVPLQVGMLPLFLLLKQMGLINTYWAVILPSMATIYGIFMVRQYALSIPDSLLDAARIDGAGELRIFFSIVLPLLRPVLATLGIFTFLVGLERLYVAADRAHRERPYTLPVALAILSGEHVQDAELMMAGSLVTMLPVLALFALLQKQLIGGIMMGGVKG